MGYEQQPQNAEAPLDTVPGLVLTPRSLWAELTYRLVVEANIANGVPWMLRSEALNRLLAHPAGQDAAIAVVRDLALDRSSHSMAGTMSALEVTPTEWRTTWSWPRSSIQ
jgi:hypothetical protein